MTANHHQLGNLEKELDGEEKELEGEEKGDLERMNCGCCSIAILAMADVCIATCPDLYTCLATLIGHNFDVEQAQLCTGCIDRVLQRRFIDFFLTDWGRQTL